MLQVPSTSLHTSGASTTTITFDTSGAGSIFLSGGVTAGVAGGDGAGYHWFHLHYCEFLDDYRPRLIVQLLSVTMGPFGAPFFVFTDSSALADELGLDSEST